MKRMSSLPLLGILISFATIQPVYAQKSSKSTPSAQATSEEARAQANIDTVMAFYKAAADTDFEQARQYIGPYYIEHDPNREDGIAGLQKALSPGRIGARKTFTIERLVGDAEYVILHAKLVPTMGPAPAGTTAPAVPQGGPPPELRPSEVAEIFRLFDGKIVEHWKVVQ